MSSWSKNRKTIIGGGTAVAALIFLVIPIFLFFYKAPTCFDGKKNGAESGVDCGGSCVRLCSSSFLPPQVAWTRYEEVADGLYNIAAYIVNPNVEGEARDVPYHMAVYDTKGMLVIDRQGTVTIPPHRNTLAYEGAVDTGKRVPAKILFEFTSQPNWEKRSDPLKYISIGDKNYNEDASGSSLLVTLGNNSISDMRNLAVYAVLYDGGGNALGFSRTIVDEIPGQGTATAPFTWPVERGGGVISIEVLPMQE